MDMDSEGNEMSPETEQITQLSLMDQKSLDPEVSLSRYVMRNVVRPVKLDGEQLEQWILPAAEFSGDIFAAEMTAGGRLNMILADGSGHGLGTAICMMPITDVFYAMASKGSPIPSIAKELNQKMVQLLPKDRFVTALLASINWASKKVEVWNGGSPAPFFLNKEGEYLKIWKSQHLPLGILSSQDFDDTVESFQWEHPGQFLMFTDGLTTAKNGEDEIFGTERMHQVLLGSSPDERFRDLKTAVIDHISEEEAGDDISLISINCDPELLPKTEKKELQNQEKAYAPSTWKVSLHLNETDMKNIDVLPVMLAWLKQVGIDQKDTQRLFLIISELYTNALDHGLLRLDSSLKSSSSGFDEYLEQRSQRINNLEKGSIEIKLERMLDLEGDIMKIRMEDSGEGFDFIALFRDLEKTDDSDIVNLHGKGMALVYTLTQNMQYFNQGKVIELEYLLSN